MKNTILSLAALTAALALAAGCQNSGHETTQAATHEHVAAAAHMPAVTSAIAVIHPTQGNQVSGTVRFTQQGDDAVHVVADLTGLTPNSKHGFHIHEFGDCSAPDATSAGGHYNPGGHPHAGPDADAAHRHPGDMGNLDANAQGNAHLDLTLSGVSVAGGPNPILGRGVIVHAKADDLKTQPTGDAGGRIGCGVIGVAKAK